MSVRLLSDCLSLQGLMFGYATDETEEFMPLSILLAHKLNHRMRELSHKGECPWILPDGKSQVSHFRRNIKSGIKHSQFHSLLHVGMLMIND